MRTFCRVLDFLVLPPKDLWPPGSGRKNCLNILHNDLVETKISNKIVSGLWNVGTMTNDHGISPNLLIQLIYIIDGIGPNLLL